jgi:heme-degrading monooxygenase HmoA
MTHLLVRHNVADFAKWKPLYDAHLTARQKAGLQEKNLLRSVDNPNEVVLLFEAEDLKKAQVFTESSELREAMQKAGVVGQPDILFLN